MATQVSRLRLHRTTVGVRKVLLTVYEDMPADFPSLDTNWSPSVSIQLLVSASYASQSVLGASSMGAAWQVSWSRAVITPNL